MAYSVPYLDTEPTYSRRSSIQATIVYVLLFIFFFYFLPINSLLNFPQIPGFMNFLFHIDSNGQMSSCDPAKKKSYLG